MENLHPKSLNVVLQWLLPGRECAKMFIKTGCELVSEVSLKVKGEVTKTYIALFAPHMGTFGLVYESGN